MESGYQAPKRNQSESLCYVTNDKSNEIAAGIIQSRVVEEISQSDEVYKDESQSNKDTWSIMTYDEGKRYFCCFSALNTVKNI